MELNLLSMAIEKDDKVDKIYCLFGIIFSSSCGLYFVSEKNWH